MKICIDPGHGGSKDGAVGAYGTKEKDINLSVALYMAMALRAKDIDCILTRDKDKDLSLKERCAIANEAEVDLFISLHCNANVNRIYEGIECYTTRGTTKADNWARQFKKALMIIFPDHKDFAGAGERNKNFYVLKHTVAPAVLIEMEFISNIEQEAFLKEESNQVKFAATLVEVINIQKG